MEGQLKEELPTGIGLRVSQREQSLHGTLVNNMYVQVPKPTRAFNTMAVSYYGAATAPVAPNQAMQGEPDEDGLFDFDQLPLEYQRGAIVDMLNLIPKVICSFYRRNGGLTFIP
jgi:hypothetical protein